MGLQRPEMEVDVEAEVEEPLICISSPTGATSQHEENEIGSLAKNS